MFSTQSKIIRHPKKQLLVMDMIHNQEKKNHSKKHSEMRDDRIENINIYIYV